jgi:hypothetical protein
MIILSEIGSDGMIYPAQGIFNLTGLEPGKSYMIKMAEEAEFTFPECQISK